MNKLCLCASHRLGAVPLLALLLGLSRPVWPAPEAWGPPMAEAELAQHRGGYETPQGLQLAFGMTRQVFVNGVLQSSQTWQMAASGQGAAGQTPNGMGDLMPLIIQNRQHGQEIRTLTVLDAQINTLQLLGAARLQQSLRSALIDALPR